MGKERGGGYSNIRALRVCAAQKPPFFGLSRSYRLHFFDLARSDRPPPPFHKYSFVCFTFPTWSAPKDPRFKIYVSLLNPPRFSVRGRSESPPFYSEGPIPVPYFQTLCGTYIPLSYMSNTPAPPPPTPPPPSHPTTVLGFNDINYLYFIEMPMYTKFDLYYKQRGFFRFSYIDLNLCNHALHEIFRKPCCRGLKTICLIKSGSANGLYLWFVLHAYAYNYKRRYLV